MLFNSFDFLCFFVVVTSLYFVLPHRFRWALLLVASCLFYMSFIPVYLLILLATIVIDYIAGRCIETSANPATRKYFLVLSIVSVCSILFVFKYFNFVNENAEAIARALGWNYPIQALRIILPIGLSFHTFQSLSYVIEVYRGRQKAERHFGIYALYVMYFPQLVAGPIERPQNLLHQFYQEQTFNLGRVYSGLSLVLWGLFKKVVVADSLAPYVNTIYGSSDHHTGTSLLLATYLFAIQIYGDFSGYSDMARGISRIYGIELMRNFETPYFSTSISEFWTRWHISLSTWFKDYVYIPLGGNRRSLPRNFLNVLLVFLLSGLWHGANWTFLAWGALHGIYVIAERCVELLKERMALPAATALTDGFIGAVKLVLTFHLVLISWVFFRADTFGGAVTILRKIALDHGPLFWDAAILQSLLAIAGLLMLDAFNRQADYWNNLPRFSAGFRLSYSLFLLFSIVLLGVEHGTQFIYFQF